MAHYGRGGFAQVVVPDVGDDGIGPSGGVDVPIIGDIPSKLSVLGWLNGVFLILLFILLQDGAEIPCRKSPISDVQLPCPFRRCFFGICFFPFFVFELMQHSLDAKKELFQSPCFTVHPLHTASSWWWQMLVRMLQ